MQRIKNFFVRYEKHIATIALVAGFIFDNITLRRVDLLLENVIFGFDLTVAGICIILINLVEVGKLRGKYFKLLHPWLAILIQFFIGNLFNRYTIFYFRSATLAASWPFILVLVVLMIGNERLKKQYEILIFQVGVYFTALFTYMIFIVPTILKEMNAGIFLLSGAISFLLIALLVLTIGIFARTRVQQSKVGLLTTVIGIWATISIFYFTNILPPIPLELKDVEVYHSVLNKGQGIYEVTYEPQPFSWFFYKHDVIHIRAGEPVYMFTQVFAPTLLETNIVHEWQYMDEKTRDWHTVSTIAFPVLGGRDEGYRGYSLKHNTFSGLWRVNVKTTRGQLIGRTTFRIELVDAPVALETRTK